ncbi:MAG TPA: hypothetical protein VFO21_17990 [Vicinamibacterales bacterium]|jgi:hypothetical protein|nr:hypothetical protein [Vicinamibacterales bacterium]
MNRGGFLAIVGFAVLLFVAVPYARESILVDGCLDTGGSYNYIDEACDHSKKHPYSPYTQRHPLAASAALSGVVLTVAGTVIARRSKQQAN